jgi:hypothetical protein
VQTDHERVGAPSPEGSAGSGGRAPGLLPAALPAASARTNPNSFSPLSSPDASAGQLVYARLQQWSPAQARALGCAADVLVAVQGLRVTLLCRFLREVWAFLDAAPLKHLKEAFPALLGESFGAAKARALAKTKQSAYALARRQHTEHVRFQLEVADVTMFVPQHSYSHQGFSLAVNLVTLTNQRFDLTRRISSPVPSEPVGVSTDAGSSRYPGPAIEGSAAAREQSAGAKASGGSQVCARPGKQPREQTFSQARVFHRERLVLEMAPLTIGSVGFGFQGHDR